MRKLIFTLFVVFAAAFGIGALAPAPAAAGFGSCYYKCDCAGNGLRCCIVNGVESCKAAPEWNCPQVYNC